MRPRTKPRVHLEDDVFAKRIDGRVGDLRESLAEKPVQGARRVRERSERGVVSHGPDSVFAIGDHGLQNHAHVFARVAEAMLQAVELGRVDGSRCFDRVLKRNVLADQVLILTLGVVNEQNVLVL